MTQSEGARTGWVTTSDLRTNWPSASGSTSRTKDSTLPCRSSFEKAGEPSIDVSFPNGDGFSTWGSPTPDAVCVIDPSDTDMTHSDFLEYGTLRARGYSAIEASEQLWPRRRWFKRRALP